MLATRFSLVGSLLVLGACSSSTDADDAGAVGGASGFAGGASLAGAGGMSQGGASGAASVGAGTSGHASGGARGEEDALFVPRSLTITPLPGGNGVLEVRAFTLQEGANGAEIFAALKNVGGTPACSAGFSVELYDEAGESLAVGISGLLTQRFYRVVDGEGIAACVGPGDVTMAAITDLPSELRVTDVASAVYRCPYFALDVAPIAGMTIIDVKTATGNAGTTYTGSLVNGFDVTVSNPSVRVFPLNRAGRPLGVTAATGTVVIPPGDSWAFETSPVAVAGMEYAAFPAGALDD